MRDFSFGAENNPDLVEIPEFYIIFVKRII